MGKVFLKRPLQHLIPLEVESSDSAVQRVPVDSTAVQTPAIALLQRSSLLAVRPRKTQINLQGLNVMLP